MTHDELVNKIDEWTHEMHHILGAVIELHKPKWGEGEFDVCKTCLNLSGISVHYPCETIKVIEKALI